MSSPLKPDPATGNVSSRGQGVAIGSTRGAINPECLLETVPILRSPPNPQTNNDAHDKKPINEEEAHKDTSTDAKLEDEEALKPPNIDLPAFTFDDYESDEESFVRQVCLPPSTLTPKSFEVDAKEEKKFYDALNAGLEAYVQETGKYPQKMPLAMPTFQMERYHLRAMARVMKENRWTKEVVTFQAQKWPYLKALGLKWILNAIHNCPSVTRIHIEEAQFEVSDGERLARFLGRTPGIKALSLPRLTTKHDSVLCAILRDLSTNTSLTYLNLQAASYSETSFSSLVEAITNNKTLTELDLRGSDFTYHNRAQRFMQAILDNPHTRLEQIHFPLMRGAVIYTTQMLQYNRSLIKIDLSGIILSTYATMLQSALQSNTRLKELDLANTQLDDATLATLLEPLWYNNTLETLNLSTNPYLRNESAGNIADMLMQNSSLTALKLDDLSGISKDKLAKRLAAALRVNSSLHHLSMQSSHIESNGATVLGEALVVNHGLHSLNLCYSEHFDDSCLAALLKGLKSNHGLHTLELRYCKLGDASAKTLIPFLKATTTLTVRLDLSHSKMSTTAIAQVKEAIASNPALRKLSFGEPTLSLTLSQRISTLTKDFKSFFSD